MELSLSEVRRIEKAIKEGTPIPDGPTIPYFDPQLMASAIESEVARGRILGWGKVSMHFDLDDAAEFARWLRRRRS